MTPEGSNDAQIAAIQRELAKIERDHGVRILYAAESGSRAWGFPSPDSDYDVRFIYLHPSEWYVSLVERRDVIEVMAGEELDISGWDLRKALRLFLKSNPALHEWLVSPIVYRSDTGLADSLRRLAKQSYSLRAVGASYLNWARQHEARHLRDRDEVSLKKYLYVIRPLTAGRYSAVFRSGSGH